MTKYRIRLKNARVIGPFVESQLHELKSKGHIQGNEEAQVFPTGDWLPIASFDFFAKLMDEDNTSFLTDLPDEKTFVIDLAKLRNKKNEIEIDKVDVLKHEPLKELTETVHLSQKSETPSTHTSFELNLDREEKKAEVSGAKLIRPAAPKPSTIEDTSDKTSLNPIAQKDLERIRKNTKSEEERKQAEIEQSKIDEEEKQRAIAAQKLIDADESTQMIRLDRSNSELMIAANEEEKKIEIEIKEIKKKNRKAEEAEEKKQDDEDNEIEAAAKKKKKKLIIGLAILVLGYVFLFPGEEKTTKPPFKHIEPIVEFPVPFDKSDIKRSKIEFEKAQNLFALGDYLSLIKAGVLLKSSHENNIDSEDIISLLVRNYAEQLRYSKEDKLGNAQIVFNLIQAKRPFLAKNPNGVIGLNLFYMSINKFEAAADVVSKYLKLYPKNVTPDLFAVYLKTLIKTGKIDLAKQFKVPLEKAPQKTPYVYEALIEYSLLNQENEKAFEYISDANKLFPKLVSFYLRKADFLIKQKNYKDAEPLLIKAEELNLEYNDLNRAKFLELQGLLLAFKGDVKTATAYFQKSLSIEDSYELRMRLADLASGEDPANETDKLIAESKSIKLLIQAKEFFDKRNYELALSAAAKATDVMTGHIPSELFLAKVQLRLGLAKQALKTLEDLIHKYPDDKSINFALLDAYIETYKFNDAKNRIGVMSSGPLKDTYEFASANGRLYIRMGDSLQAISWLKNSINMNPLNDTDIHLLAEIIIKRANFDAARLLLNKCMELDPVNPDYRIAYAKVVYEQQDDLSAIGYLLGLLNEFGENPKVLSEIAVFYYRAGRVKDFEAYKEKLEKMPVRDKSLYEFLIKAALLDERFNEIPELVEKLLAIEPGEIEAMMTAGRVLYENGKLVEAAKWFKRIQEKLETYPKVQYYIAKIKYLSKDYDGALKEVEADLKANGDNDADLTLMAQIYAEKGELIQAENLFKKSQKINPKAFDSLVGLADISTKRNNFDLALDLYKKAMTQKGDEPIIHRKIGDVYRLLGQGALAVESYKLYLEMKPEAADKNQIESYINLMQ
jgi:tetratricopeptide (TPR) repeat protein